MSLIEGSLKQNKGKKGKGFKRLKKISKTAQDTIPFYEIYDNGLLLTGENTYTLLFSFTNIDYSLLRDEEQEEIYERYQRLLNALPIDVHFQEFIMNTAANTSRLREILIGDNKEVNSKILKDYNEIIENYIVKAEGAISEKITIVAMSYTPSVAVDNVNVLFRYFNELQNFYSALGSEVKQLNPEQVLAILYEFYHALDNTEFKIPVDLWKRGGSIKDSIAPSTFVFKPKEIEIGNQYTRVLYMARYDRDFDDMFIRDLLDNNYKITVSKQIQRIDKSEAQDKVKKNIFEHQGRIQARLEKNAKRGTDFIPYAWREKAKELEDLQERLADTSCELFKIAVFVSITASTMEELEELTEALRAKAKNHQIVLDCLVRQQEKALNSLLPFGINRFSVKDGNNISTYVLSDAAGVLIPFSARSYISNGLCYGLNKHTNAIVVLDRTDEMNANGFILGTSGSGKSVFAKSEIIDTIIRYPNDQKIIIDAESEYAKLITAFNGATLKLSANADTKINIFDTNLNYTENGNNAIALKSEFLMSIIESARGFELSAADKSLIDGCVREIYCDFLTHMGDSKYVPTLKDFYNALKQRNIPEAQQMCLDIEIYVNGSFSTFSERTNIEIENKLLSIDISEMGEQIRTVGLQVVLEYVWQKVVENKKKGIRTWLWIDEFSLMFNDAAGKETVRSALYFQRVFQRIRKYGGVPTGITQNIGEVLESEQARIMLSNSEFVVLLQQKKKDLDKLVELFALSPSQENYLKSGEKGTGVIVSGKKIIPFDRRIPTDNEIYKLCNTDFNKK